NLQQHGHSRGVGICHREVRVSIAVEVGGCNLTYVSTDWINRRLGKTWEGTGLSKCWRAQHTPHCYEEQKYTEFSHFSNGEKGDLELIWLGWRNYTCGPTDLQVWSAL